MPDIAQGVLLFLVAAVNVAVFAAVFYFVRRWLAKRLPAPVRRRGQRNALICGVGVLAVFGVLTAAIWAIFQQTIAASAGIAFGIFWIFIFTAFFVGWIGAKKSAGPLLLDCGPHPTKKLFLFNAAFFLLFFGAGGLARFLQEADLYGFGLMLFAATAGVYFVVMATGRLQVHENGLWQYWGLLKWDRLQSYTWEGESLLIQAKTRFPGLGKGALPVPAQHKDAIEELLAKYCRETGASQIAQREQTRPDELSVSGNR